MELAKHKINREGRNSFHNCLNFSAAVGTLGIIADGASSILASVIGLLREGSFTVKRITNPTTMPGIPAIIKDL